MTDKIVVLVVWGLWRCGCQT